MPRRRRIVTEEKWIQLATFSPPHFHKMKIKRLFVLFQVVQRDRQMDGREEGA